MQSPQLGASLQGRLRNTDLPVSRCLYPLFETVVNAIYAIDDRVNSDNAFVLSEGMIRISLSRAADSDLFGGKAENLAITIEDNGIGFNDEDYDSFFELGTMCRALKCCKGIGENKREEGELPPLGLIPCTEGCGGQIEYLEMDKTGVRVAHYYIELLEPKKLQEKFMGKYYYHNRLNL